MTEYYFLSLLVLSLRKNDRLVDVLLNLGPDITGDPDIIFAIFRRFGYSDVSPPEDTEVLEILTGLAALAAEGVQLCDTNALVKTLISFVSYVYWP